MLKYLIFIILQIVLINCYIEPIQSDVANDTSLMMKINSIFEELNIISIIFTTNDKFPMQLMYLFENSSKFNEKNYIIFNLKKNFINNLAKNRNHQFDGQFTKYFNRLRRSSGITTRNRKQVEDYLFENLFDEDFVNDIFEINKQIYFVDDTDDLYMDSKKDNTKLVNSKDVQNLYSFYKRIGYIVMGMKLKQLKSYFETFITSSGTYLFIIEVTFIGEESVQQNEEIFNCLEIAWREYNCFSIFLLIDDNIFTFDPFAYDIVKKSYGKIVTYSGTDKEDLNMKLMDLKGYPLTLEIFRSQFSIPIFKSKEVVGYYGADAEVANILRSAMNFSGELIYH